MADNEMCLITDVISAAIAQQVRELGGDSEAIRNISGAAGYAVICWSLAAAQRGQDIGRQPVTTEQHPAAGEDKTCAA